MKSLKKFVCIYRDGNKVIQLIFEATDIGMALIGLVSGGIKFKQIIEVNQKHIPKAKKYK